MAVQAVATLPAATISTAWLAAWTATSDDRDSSMYRALNVEQFPAGARLTATNGYLLVCAWAPHDPDGVAEPPDPDEAPQRAVLVRDADQRIAALMRHAHKITHCREPADADVHLTVRARHRVAQPALDPDLEAQAFTASLEAADAEQVTVPVLEMPFPNWRLWRRSEPVDRLDVTPAMLVALGRLARLIDGRVEWGFAGRTGAVTFTATAGGCPIVGMWMPARPAEAS